MPVARILIADDNVEFLDICREYLCDKFELIFAEDGEKAWRLIKSDKPDVIVTDVSMPAMNGLGLFDKIRADKTLNKTPILIITGLTKEYDLPKGFWKRHTGADGFLEKPFDMSQLRAEIERLIKYRLGKSDFKPTGYL